MKKFKNSMMGDAMELTTTGVGIGVMTEVGEPYGLGPTMGKVSKAMPIMGSMVAAKHVMKATKKISKW
jgi:hypothetical protein